MTTFRRLSEREGRRPPRPVPYEGVPPHLESHLIDWISAGLSFKEAAAQTITLRLDIPVPPGYDDRDALVRAGRVDKDELLDVVDLMVKLGVGNQQRLEVILALGGSVWTVGNECLERRVTRPERAALEAATSTEDQVSEELNEAWSKAFGRTPDPSDAWDHAIRAVEALLIPVVVPAQAKANLGHVAGQLKNNPEGYDIGLAGNGGWTAGTSVEGMVRLIWPNPDRHPSGGHRTPSLREAEKVVHLAVTIVNLCRDLT